MAPSYSSSPVISHRHRREVLPPSDSQASAPSPELPTCVTTWYVPAIPHRLQPLVRQPMGFT
jgi:hypothetical protein